MLECGRPAKPTVQRFNLGSAPYVSQSRAQPRLVGRGDLANANAFIAFRLRASWRPLKEGLLPILALRAYGARMFVVNSITEMMRSARQMPLGLLPCLILLLVF